MLMGLILGEIMLFSILRLTHFYACRKYGADNAFDRGGIRFMFYGSSLLITMALLLLARTPTNMGVVLLCYCFASFGFAYIIWDSAKMRSWIANRDKARKIELTQHYNINEQQILDDNMIKINLKQLLEVAERESGDALMDKIVVKVKVQEKNGQWTLTEKS